MKTRLSFLMLLVTLGLGVFSPSDASAKTLRIGVVVDRANPQMQQLANKIVDEIRGLNEPEHTIEFSAESLRVGDGSKANIRATLQTLLDDKDIDMVLAVGPLSSVVATQIPDLSKPVFAPFILDPDAQGVPGGAAGSRVRNLSYLSVPYTFGKAYKKLHEITKATRVGIVLDGGLGEVAPNAEAVLKRQISDLGGTAVLIRSDSKVGLKALEEVDAVIVAPLNTLDPVFQNELLAELTARKLPSFGFLSLESVEKGLLVTEYPSAYIHKLGRRLAVNTQRFLAGEDPGQFDTHFEGGPMRIHVNIATAGKIAFDLPWKLEIEAVRVGDAASASPALTFEEVLLQAGAQNLGVKAAEFDVLADTEAIGEVRALLLPSVDFFASLTTVDVARAQESQGTFPQHKGSGSIRVEQLIYSDEAWAGLTIQEATVDGTRAYQTETMLDVTQAAAIAYFNVLRAQSLVQVNQSNLELDRKNLELARVRFSVGAATEADVFRWESQIARSQQSLVQAFLDARKSKIELARIINHKNSDEIHVEFARDNESELSRFEDFMLVMNNKRHSGILAQFLTQEAIENSPELAQVQAGLAIQNRERTRSTRAYWVPSVFARADFSATAFRAGEGSDAVPGSEGPSNLGYELSIQLSLPLFTGGERLYTTDRVDFEIQRLEAQRQDIELLLQQRVQNAIYDSAASMISIELSEVQFETAKKSLELVSNAYAAGQVSIVDLLDAQNNTFTARQQMVNATYDFMIAIANLERSIGANRIFAPEREREAFEERMRTHFAEQGVAQ